MTMLTPSSKKYADEWTRLFRPSSLPSEIIIEDKIRSIEALLRKLATRQVTAQEAENNGYIQEVASLTREVLDFDATREDAIKRPQLDDFRARLTKIKHWLSESSNVINAWNAGKLTRLRNEDSATPQQCLRLVYKA